MANKRNHLVLVDKTRHNGLIHITVYDTDSYSNEPISRTRFMGTWGELASHLSEEWGVNPEFQHVTCGNDHNRLSELVEFEEQHGTDEN